ncbi:GNAT family N-acetyltransferase, partial [Micromonospora azadirachtae]
AASTARAAGLPRLWLITTNDNLRALRFYQRRGLRLVGVDPGAVDRARRLKPEIPLLGEDGIPLHDELILELRTATDSSPQAGSGPTRVADPGRRLACEPCPPRPGSP